MSMAREYRRDRAPRVVEVAWDPGAPAKSLEALRSAIVGAIAGDIAWYRRRAPWMRFQSRIVYWSAYLLVALGGLYPVTDQEMLNALFGAGQIMARPTTGYALLAVAATVYGADKLFNFSATWMRYTITSVYLQELLDRFCARWIAIAGAVPPPSPVQEGGPEPASPNNAVPPPSPVQEGGPEPASPNDAVPLSQPVQGGGPGPAHSHDTPDRLADLPAAIPHFVRLARETLEELNLIVRKETEQWVTDFQASLIQFDGMVKRSSQEGKPRSGKDTS